MKKYNKAYLIFFITISYTTYTMDIKSDTQQSFDELVACINAKINTNYSSMGFCCTSYSSLFLPNQTKIDILNTIASVTDNALLSQVLSLLFQKNYLVKASIEHFINLTLEAIEKITCATLSTIENPLSPPTALKELSILVRTFILSNAYNYIKYSYTAILRHNSPIICCDISPATHLAATAIPGNLFIWDITRGTQRFMLTCNPLKQLAFTTDGSCIVALEESNQNNYVCYGIDTKQGEQLWAIKTTGLPHSIQCTYGTTNTILSIIAQKNNKAHHTQALWQLNVATPQLLGRTNLPKLSNSSGDYDHKKKVIKGDYCARHPKTSNDKSTLLITKKKCHALYLCQTAISNSPPNIVRTIKKSQSYKSLTPFEKNIIKRKIEKKEQL